MPLIFLNLFQTPTVNPPQNPVLNLEDPQVLQDYVAPETPKVTPAFDANQYLAGLFAQGPKAPEYDMAAENNIKNMAKGQKIGELLTLLGDVYGVAKGAPVQQRQFTSTAPYLQAIQERRDRYRQSMQDYQNKEFARKVQAATLAVRNQQAQAALQQKQDQFAANYGLNKDKLALDAAYKDYLIKNGMEDNQLAKDAFNEKVRQFGLTYGQNQQRIAQGQERIDQADQKNKAKAEKDAKGKPFTYANWRGSELPIYEGEYRSLLEAALRRKGKSTDDIKRLMAQYSNSPTEEYKQLAAKEKIKQLEDQENNTVMPTPGILNYPSGTSKTSSAPKAFQPKSQLLY